MLLDDFFCILYGIHPVPYTFWIDHHRWPELAAIQAAGAIDPRFFNPQLFAAVFDIIPQPLGPLARTAATRIGIIALIGTAKYMGFIEERHRV